MAKAANSPNFSANTRQNKKKKPRGSGAESKSQKTFKAKLSCQICRGQISPENQISAKPKFSTSQNPAQKQTKPKAKFQAKKPEILPKANPRLSPKMP